MFLRGGCGFARVGKRARAGIVFVGMRKNKKAPSELNKGRRNKLRNFVSSRMGRNVLLEIQFSTRIKCLAADVF